MKKIAILTVHRAVNYGAVLQMYGLYSTLDRLGAEVNVLDYRAEGIEKREDYKSGLRVDIHLKSLLRDLFDQADRLISYAPKRKKKEKFRRFLDDTFVLSAICDRDDVHIMQDRYDAFIVGSDQVWNRNIIDEDAYFLDFVKDNCKKFSYAASFGNENGFDRDKEKNFKYIRLFSSISVRENVGITELEGACGKKVEQHLDPAFLLDMEQWKDIAEIPGKIQQNKPYILLYWASRRLKRLAAKAARTNGWRIYDLNEGIPRGCMTNVKSLDPAEFIGAVNGAEMVFTTSFHGMVFSILFHKPFKVDYNIVGECANMRQDGILSMLDLHACNIQNSKEAIVHYDWKAIDKILGRERARSMEYLTEIVRQI